METLQIDVINPKATKLLKDLAELNLISIHKKLVKSKGKGKPEAVDIYPFRQQYLRFKTVSYILREKITGDVSFEDGNYIIINEPLNISVWAKTRDEAEEAFAFTFHSIYQTFALQEDRNLTEDAQVLKQTLLTLVFSVIDNEG